MQRLVVRMVREVYFDKHCTLEGYVAVAVAAAGRPATVVEVRMVTVTSATKTTVVVLLPALLARLTFESAVTVQTVLTGHQRRSRIARLMRSVVRFHCHSPPCSRC